MKVSDPSLRIEKKKKKKNAKNKSGGLFYLSATELSRPSDNKRNCKKMRQENRGSKDQHEAALRLCRLNPCQRKRLLIREATCKVNPISAKKFENLRKVTDAMLISFCKTATRELSFLSLTTNVVKSWLI